MSSEPLPLLDWLRAAGEPNRLRVLALLRQRDLSVGELVRIMDQSQPRMSHHLKSLTGAGLVERLPEGSFVFYRAASRAPARKFLDSMFQLIDADAAPFGQDKQRLQDVSNVRAESAEKFFSAVAETWDTIRALHYPNRAIEEALLEIAGLGPFRHVIDFGTGTGRMLAVFAPYSQIAEGIDVSHQMLTVARANLEREGLSNARVRQGDVLATPFPSECADLVIIHQVLHFMDAPGEVILEASRLLEPGGRLLVVDFAPHELEFLRSDHGHHRLGIRQDAMQSWTNEAGLTLSPVRSFAPPDRETPGLTVNIWAAEKQAQTRKAIA